MNRYLVFTWERYDRNGGTDDLCGTYADIESAMDRAMERRLPDRFGDPCDPNDESVDEANVVDLKTLQKVFIANYQAYSDNTPWLDFPGVSEAKALAFRDKHEGRFYGYVGKDSQFIRVDGDQS